ncbi:MAG: serine hydrolase domain-containing protein [Candidatus Baltobacteraceae bacterium]
MTTRVLAAVIAAFFLVSSAGTAKPARPLRTPAIAAIDAMMRAEIQSGRLSSAQLAIASPRGVFKKSYGKATDHTMYELASLTKPVATTTAIMILVDRGQLALRDRVSKYIPEFAQNGKHSVTVEDLLLHTGGMPQSFPESDYTADRATILQHAYARKLDFKPGTGFSYSNLGFIILAEVVARVSGMPFEKFCTRNIFRPLGMDDSFFDTTLDGAHRAALAPQLPGQTEAGLRKAFGTVPGVNGHAGMLSTAGDLLKFVDSLLDAQRGRISFQPKPILSQRAVAALIAPHYVGDMEYRGLGWDLASGFSRNGGDLMPRGSFGHTGSSGTSLWMDPASGVAVILVSNNHFTKDAADTVGLAGRIANIVMAQGLFFDAQRVEREELEFDAAAARSAAGFPATPLPPPTPDPAGSP